MIGINQDRLCSIYLLCICFSKSCECSFQLIIQESGLYWCIYLVLGPKGNVTNIIVATLNSNCVLIDIFNWKKLLKIFDSHQQTCYFNRFVPFENIEELFKFKMQSFPSISM